MRAINEWVRYISCYIPLSYGDKRQMMIVVVGRREARVEHTRVSYKANKVHMLDQHR